MKGINILTGQQVCTPIIPATGEVEVGELRLEASPEQKHESFSEKQIKAKRAGDLA
jgi:hypothetical protein